MTINKAKLSAAVAAKKAAPKKAPAKKAPVSKAQEAIDTEIARVKAKKEKNNIDLTFLAVAKAPADGALIDTFADEVKVTVKLMRRLIDQVRARGWVVKRKARCTFMLEGPKG